MHHHHFVNARTAHAVHCLRSTPCELAAPCVATGCSLQAKQKAGPSLLKQPVASSTAVLTNQVLPPCQRGCAGKVTAALCAARQLAQHR